MIVCLFLSFVMHLLTKGHNLRELMMSADCEVLCLNYSCT